MLALLLKLVPFRDYAYAALAIAAVVFWLHHDHVEQAAGAARVTAAVTAATAKANVAAQATIDKYTSEYSSSALAIKDSYEQRIQANTASHDADLQRLRQLATSSNSAPSKVLGSAASVGASNDTGDGSAKGLGEVPSSTALELADALRADDSALVACYADRDSLTGK
jgi:hypothetical protein